MKFPSILSLPVIVCKSGKPVMILRRELLVITRSPPIVSRLGKEMLARNSEFEIRTDPPILVTFGRKMRARSWLFVMLSEPEMVFMPDPSRDISAILGQLEMLKLPPILAADKDLKVSEISSALSTMMRSPPNGGVTETLEAVVSWKRKLRMMRCWCKRLRMYSNNRFAQ